MSATNGNGGVHPGGPLSSHELENEVDRTRAAMDRTLDAIAGKLTPQQLMVEALGAFRDGSSTLATKLVETARDHPVPATVIGLGLAMLMSESRSTGPDGTSRSSVDMLREKAGDAQTAAGYGLHRAQEATSRAAEGVREQASHLAGTVSEKTSQVAGAVSEKTSQVAGSVRSTASHVGERAAEMTEQVRAKADSVREAAAQVPGQARQQLHDVQLGFWQYMDKSPLAVGAAALAAGVAAGLTVPSTRREDEWMGRTRDGLLQQAQGVRTDVVDKGRQIARTAAEAARSEAERQGLMPSELVQKLKKVSHETEQAVKSETSRVLPEALKG